MNPLTIEVARCIMDAAIDTLAAKAGVDRDMIMHVIETSPTGPTAATYERLCRAGLASIGRA